jgi:hypothetical protein
MVQEKESAQIENHPIENHEQEEYGNADHSQTEWYKELVSPAPDFYKVRSLYSSYFKNHDLIKSPQTKEYEKFVADNMGNIDSGIPHREMEEQEWYAPYGLIPVIRVKYWPEAAFVVLGKQRIKETHGALFQEEYRKYVG